MSSFLEVIVASLADAIEAEAGGADRLEVLRVPDSGGLTPPIELVEEILGAVRVPVRVMLRDEASMSVASKAELQKLCVAAKRLASLPLDGLVTGFVRDGGIDEEALREVCTAIGPKMPLTFHRAFDVAGDSSEAMRRLKTFPNVDRILTRASGATLHDRLGWAERCQDAAGPEITIVFAAGKDAMQLEGAVSVQSPLEYHVGRAARDTGHSNGPVNREKVARLKRMLAGVEA